MGAISWIAGTTENRATATSLNVALPSGILDDDGVFAILFARSALTPPAGWTLVSSQACIGSSITQTMYVYRKDTVVAADSGTAHLWTQASSATMALTYFVARADNAVVVASTLFNNGDNGTFGFDEAIDTGATDRNDAVVITAACIIVQSSGSVTPIPPTGTTIWTGTTITAYRMMAARADISSASSIDGVWRISPSDNANNGYVTLTMVLRDSSEIASVVETTSITQTEDLSGSTYNALLADGVGVHSLFGTLFQDGVSEALTTSDALIGIIPAYVIQILEGVRAFATPTDLLRSNRTVTETATLSSPVTASLGVILSELLSVLAAETPNQRSGMILSEQARIAELVNRGSPVTLAEAVGLAAAIEVKQALLVMEQLQLTEAFAPAARLGLGVAEGLRLADALSRFFGGALVEALTMTEGMTQLHRKPMVVTEPLTIDAVVSPQLVISVRLQEDLDISADEVVNALYRQEVREGVEIQIGYAAPDGSFTTWAMNTRTGAVTEYQNYAFNSFARFGNVPFGATDSGLYQLTGDDDVGEPVIAAIEGAFMQFGGTRLSRLKAAYLAAHGEDGDFVLRIETLDGATYDYGLSTRSGRSTKVHMGKGQRARYFAYALTSSGQDFDIDTLEFVPLVVDRRV